MPKLIQPFSQPQKQETLEREAAPCAWNALATGFLRGEQRAYAVRPEREFGRERKTYSHSHSSALSFAHPAVHWRECVVSLLFCLDTEAMAGASVVGDGWSLRCGSTAVLQAALAAVSGAACAEGDRLALLRATSNGLRLDVESGAKALAAHAFVAASRMTAWHFSCSAGYELATKADLRSLSSCLALFGREGGGGGAGGGGSSGANASSSASATAVCLVYSAEEGRLTLLLEQRGVVAECVLACVDADDDGGMEGMGGGGDYEFAFTRTPVRAKALLVASALLAALREICGAPGADDAQLTISSESPHLRLHTFGALGGVTVDIAVTSGALLSFDVPQGTTCVHSYRVKFLAAGLRSAALAKQALLRVNDAGMLALSFKIEAGDGQALIVMLTIMPNDAAYDDDNNDDEAPPDAQPKAHASASTTAASATRAHAAGAGADADLDRDDGGHGHSDPRVPDAAAELATAQAQAVQREAAQRARAVAPRPAGAGAQRAAAASVAAEAAAAAAAATAAAAAIAAAASSVKPQAAAAPAGTTSPVRLATGGADDDAADPYGSASFVDVADADGVEEDGAEMQYEGDMGYSDDDAAAAVEFSEAAHAVEQAAAPLRKRARGSGRGGGGGSGGAASGEADFDLPAYLLAHEAPESAAQQQHLVSLPLRTGSMLPIDHHAGGGEDAVAYDL